MRRMMAASAFAMTVATGVAVGPAWAQTLLYLDEMSDGESYNVPVGAEIRARLTQQAGTAYRWDMRNDPHVALIAPPVTEDRANGRPGGRQLRTFRIRVTQAGRFPLIFGLRAPSAGSNQVPARRILVTIDARPQGVRPAPPPPPLDGPDTIEPLTEADAGDRIDIPVGQERVIALPSNLSTGYRWEAIGAVNVSILGPITEERPRRPAGFVGGGGTSLVRFRINRRGPASVTLLYVGPGGGRASKTRAYRFVGI